MNLDALKQDFEIYLKDLEKENGKNYKVGKSNLEMFKYVDELKDYLELKYDMDEDDLSEDIDDVLKMDFKDGKIVDNDNSSEDNEKLTFMSIVNFFLSDSKAKKVIDLNVDGELTHKEVNNLFMNVRNFDKNKDKLTLDDIAIAADAIRNKKLKLVDIEKEKELAELKKIEEQKQKEAEEARKKQEAEKLEREKIEKEKHEKEVQKAKDDYNAASGELEEFDKNNPNISIEEYNLQKVELEKEIAKLGEEIGSNNTNDIISKLKELKKSSIYRSPMVKKYSEILKKIALKEQNEKKLAEIQDLIKNSVLKQNERNALVDKFNSAKGALEKLGIDVSDLNTNSNVDKAENDKGKQNNKEQKIAKLEAKLEKLQAKIDKGVAYLKDLSEGIEPKLKEFAEKMLNLEDNLENVITTLNNELEAKIQELTIKIQELKKEISNEIKEKNRFTEDLEQNHKKQVEANDDIEKYTELKDQATDEKKETEALKYKKLIESTKNSIVALKDEETILNSLVDNSVNKINELTPKKDELMAQKNDMATNRDAIIQKDERYQNATNAYNESKQQHDSYKEQKTIETKNEVNDSKSEFNNTKEELDKIKKVDENNL